MRFRYTQKKKQLKNNYDHKNIKHPFCTMGIWLSSKARHPRIVYEIDGCISKF